MLFSGQLGPCGIARHLIAVALTTRHPGVSDGLTDTETHAHVHTNTHILNVTTLLRLTVMVAIY